MAGSAADHRQGTMVVFNGRVTGSLGFRDAADVWGIGGEVDREAAIIEGDVGSEG